MLTKIAFRNIFRQKRRSILTAISMAGGYVLMSLALSLSNGSYNHMIDLFTRDHTGHIQIHYQDFLRKQKIYKSITNIDEVYEQLEKVPEVRGFSPRIISAALAYGEVKSLPVGVIAIDPVREADTSLLSQKVKQGAYLSPQQSFNQQANAWNSMIGFGLADALNLKLGDTYVLISQGADGSIANDLFYVYAIVGSKTSWEKSRVFISLEAGQEFLSLYGAVHQISVLLDHQKNAQELAQVIQKQLGDTELVVSPWQEVEEVFYKSMRSDVVGTYVTQGIIIFIVCIGILNTVLMTIIERTREFGVLKAIGTSPFMLFKLILLETGILAALSCVGGFLIALPLNYWFMVVGVEMPPMDVGGIIYDHMYGELTLQTMLMPVLVVVASAMFVSIFPALRAARISPIDAIRGG